MLGSSDTTHPSGSIPPINLAQEVQRSEAFSRGEKDRELEIAGAKVAAGKKREETLNMKLDLAAAVQLWISFCQEFATFGKSRKRIFAV